MTGLIIDSFAGGRQGHDGLIGADMKPIIMSTEDVRGILDGRKTMFRQVMKPQPTYWNDGERLYDKDNIVGPEFYNPIRVGKDGEEYPGKEVYGIYSDNGEYGCEAPYKPGDVLWVRETWCELAMVDADGYTHYDDCKYFYATDGDYQIDLYDDNGFYLDDQKMKWRSSVTMPRSAARLFLGVVSVRVERVQDIGADDAYAEGYHETEPIEHRPRSWFSSIWDARNAKRGYGWDKNPWVWVYSFERVDKPAGWPGREGGE